MSQGAKIGIVVIVIIIIAAGGYYAATQVKTSPSPSSSSTGTSSSATGTFGPTNSSELIDDSQTANPDTLDPCCGDYGFVDDAIYLSVFQQLVSFDGPNSTTGVVIPCLATNYTINKNENYTFNIRPNVVFSDGNAVNASIVWFSFVRNLYLGQPIGYSNYEYVTVNQTTPTVTGMYLPWGLLNAVQNVTGLPTTTNYTLAQTVLNQMLSNFNSNNATIQKIMAYPHQAYVVTGPMTFVINELKSYPYLLTDIAQWWAAIVDPAYIDAHGGVQANTPNSYFVTHGGPGTGPYEIASVGTGMSDVVMKANPTYWGLKVSNIAPILQPPHIPVIILNYALSSNSRQEAFATNQAQISYVDFSVIGQAWSAYNYKQYTTFNQVLDNFGNGPNDAYVELDVGKFPTNVTDFRLAIMHAINYTQLAWESYGFNGTLYATEYLGPLSQGWDQYYNPGNLSMYSYNTTLAIQYLNQAGIQGSFSITLPNGTVIGDTTAAALSPLTFGYVAPNTPVEETEEAVLEADLEAIGIPVATQGETAALVFSWTTPGEFTNMLIGFGWGPDWNDPILQELDEVVTPEIFMTFMNLTSVNDILANLTFNNNQTQMINGIKQIYNITYNYAPYIWLPNPDNYILKQPYVQGLIYSPYTTVPGQYWYNTLYYKDV